jgi:hypothetical protein
MMLPFGGFQVHQKKKRKKRKKIAGSFLFLISVGRKQEPNPTTFEFTHVLLQRQRCSKLECFSKLNKMFLFSKRLRLLVAL